MRCFQATRIVANEVHISIRTFCGMLPTAIVGNLLRIAPQVNSGNLASGAKNPHTFPQFTAIYAICRRPFMQLAGLFLISV